MAYTPKTLEFDFLGTSIGAVLTNPASTKSKIKTIDFFNIHTSPVTVTIWCAPADSGSVRTVSANDRYQRAVIVVLAGNSVGIEADWILSATNDCIKMKADVADKVSGVINYIEEA